MVEQTKMIILKTTLNKLPLLLVLLAILTAEAFCGEPISINSMKYVDIVNGRAYVAVGYPKNHELYQDMLNKLWGRTSCKQLHR